MSRLGGINVVSDTARTLALPPRQSQGQVRSPSDQGGAAAGFAAAGQALGEAVERIGAIQLQAERSQKLIDAQSKITQGVEDARQAAMEHTDPAEMDRVYREQVNRVKDLFIEEEDKDLMLQVDAKFQSASDQGLLHVKREAVSRQMDTNAVRLQSAIETEQAAYSRAVRDGRDADADLHLDNIVEMVRSGAGTTRGLENEGAVESVVKRAVDGASMRSLEDLIREDPKSAILALSLDADANPFSDLPDDVLEKARARAEQSRIGELRESVAQRRRFDPQGLLADIRSGLGSEVPEYQASTIKSLEAELKARGLEELSQSKAADQKIADDIFVNASRLFSGQTPPPSIVEVQDLKDAAAGIQDAKMRLSLTNGIEERFHQHNAGEYEREILAAQRGEATLPSVQQIESDVDTGHLDRGRANLLVGKIQAASMRANSMEAKIARIEGAHLARVPVFDRSGMQDAADVYFRRLTQEIPHTPEGTAQRYSVAVDMAMNSGVMPTMLQTTIRAGLRSDRSDAIAQSVSFMENLRTTDRLAYEQYFTDDERKLAVGISTVTNIRPEDAATSDFDIAPIRDRVANAINPKDPATGQFIKNNRTRIAAAADEALIQMVRDEFHINLDDKTQRGLQLDKDAALEKLPKNLRTRFHAAVMDMVAGGNTDIELAKAFAVEQFGRKIGKMGLGSDSDRIVFNSPLKVFGNPNFGKTDMEFQAVQDLGDAIQAGEVVFPEEVSGPISKLNVGVFRSKIRLDPDPVDTSRPAYQMSWVDDQGIPHPIFHSSGKRYLWFPDYESSPKAVSDRSAQAVRDRETSKRLRDIESGKKRPSLKDSMRVGISPLFELFQP